MKKLFPLFILIILVSFMPIVKAETESLYVDSYTGDLSSWDELNEPSPYLADESTGFVHEVKSSGAVVGYFGFVNPSGSGTISSVELYVECEGQHTNDKIYIYVDCSDGSGWVNEGTIYVNQLYYDWEILSLTSRLDSWSDIQNAQIYLYYQGVGGGDDIYVRRAYLYVFYTPAGEEHLRELSQSLSWTGDSYRTCNLKRDSSQGLTLASDSKRTWDGHITLTQSTTLATTALRDISYLRTFTQPIFISANTFTKQLEYLLRNLNLGLSLTLDSSRTSGVSRLIDQGITLSNLASRNGMLFRTLTQGLSFLSSAMGQITGGAEQILRTLTLSMSLTIESLRTGSLLRILSQGIAFTNNAIGQKYLGALIKRLVTLSMLFSSNTDLSMRIVNEFNVPLLIFHVVPLYLSYRWLKEPYPLWSGVGGMMWFMLALLVLQDNPENYVITRIYTLFGIIFIMLTLVSVLKQIKDVSEGRTDDDFFEF